MSSIKFYSEYNSACGTMLSKLIEKVKSNEINCSNIMELIEVYNILKYLSVERFKDYITQQTGYDMKICERGMRKNIGQFLGANKEGFLELYKDIAYTYKEDFFSIIEEYKLYKNYSSQDVRQFIHQQKPTMYIMLKFKKFVETFDLVIKEDMVLDAKSAEIILSKFLKEQDLYLPTSLQNQDIEKLLIQYIQLDEANTNVLRKMIHFPLDKGFIISDKIKLYANRKIKQQEEEIFSRGTAIESGVGISYSNEQEEPIIFNMDGQEVEVSVSRVWVKENNDYPTLWNNFIYLFNYCDLQMRIELVSKKSSVGVLESMFNPSGEHLYVESTAFGFQKMLSDIELISYIKVLSVEGIRFEEMIEWFFNTYIKNEFSVENFIIQMPSEATTYFEKCRTILPEIDRIFKQYNMLVEDGEIDQELMQISSSSVKVKGVKSFNDKKYVYAIGDWFRIASYLLFSDQSTIFYLADRDNQHRNFYELITKEKLKLKNFQERQISDMQWLFENRIIEENTGGTIQFVNLEEIYILKEMYYEEVLSYWRCPQNIKDKLDELHKKNFVNYECSLFTKNEQDYLDYYLNKSKFTNGHDIRNRYLHGTNTNDENQYEKDYYLILKLLVVIIIKINDDLIIKDGE